MGPITIVGAIIIIVGWLSLVEFDQFSEPERMEIIQKIKRSPLLILLIALMPIGILINIVGSYLGLISLTTIGASMIVLQGIIVSILFWRRKRWKGIFLFVVIIVLGVFVYIPLFVL